MFFGPEILGERLMGNIFMDTVDHIDYTISTQILA